MLKPRWRKVVRDLLGNRGRTLLVVSAIAVGVFSFGSVFITQDVLLKNIDIGFEKSNPSNITVSISEFDQNLVNWVKTQKGISDAMGKYVTGAKVVLDDSTEKLLQISSVPEFTNISLNLIEPEMGNWPPKKGEVVLERNSIKGIKKNVGDVLKVKTSNDKIYELPITGSVYENSAIPFIFTQQLTGYVSWNTLPIMNYMKTYNTLEIRVDSSIKTLNEAEKLTYDLVEKLESRDVKVLGTRVSKPNTHWATDNSKAFTAILSVIGSFSLILSGFLVVNTISAILAQQKKQIGVMKAIGARQKQVISIYLLMVLAYGILALFLAFPIGALLAFVFLKLIADFLNLNINVFFVPPRVFFMELGAALVIPVVSAFFPILSGSKKSVREAISDYQPSTSTGKVDVWLSKVRGLSLTVLISLRNVFRKRGRLALTLGTLIVAGSLFMGVVNVRDGMYKEMARILQMYDFQVSLNLSDEYPIESITERLKQIPEVVSVEGRTHVSAARIKNDGTKGTKFDITGLPYNTVFSHPVLLSGRWLEEDDSGAIVLSSTFVRDNKDLAPGSILTTDINGEKHYFNVVGVIVMSGGGGGAMHETFAKFSDVAKIKDKPGLASGFMIKTSPDDPNTQKAVSDAAEEKLKTSGISVTFKQTKNDVINSAENQFNFLIFFLLTMAVMVAIVGGLGLAGTMSLNVMERTREIGIMRSIGANDKAVRKIVLIEGLIVGFLSFLLSIPLSIPLTYGFCYAIGNAFFNRTLVVSIIPIGMLIWFVIVALVSIVASLVPARKASKISISETLSYE